MRKTLGICLRILLLTGSAFGGEMPNDKPAPPPPPSAVQESTGDATLNGEMPNDVGASLTQAALDLLALLPSLL